MVSQGNADMSKITLLITCNNFNNVISSSFKVLKNISQINGPFFKYQLCIAFINSSRVCFGFGSGFHIFVPGYVCSSVV